MGHFYDVNPQIHRSRLQWQF